MNVSICISVFHVTSFQAIICSPIRNGLRYFSPAAVTSDNRQFEEFSNLGGHELDKPRERVNRLNQWTVADIKAR